jgi:hypothetical protein
VFEGLSPTRQIAITPSFSQITFLTIERIWVTICRTWRGLYMYDLSSAVCPLYFLYHLSSRPLSQTPFMFTMDKVVALTLALTSSVRATVTGILCESIDCSPSSQRGFCTALPQHTCCFLGYAVRFSCWSAIGSHKPDIRSFPLTLPGFVREWPSSRYQCLGHERYSIQFGERLLYPENIARPGMHIDGGL